MSIMIQVEVVVHPGIKSRVAREGEGVVAADEAGEHPGLQVHRTVPASLLGTECGFKCSEASEHASSRLKKSRQKKSNDPYPLSYQLYTHPGH